MFGFIRQLWDSNDDRGPRHLDDSILLAYTRKQPIEHWQYEHIHRCADCLHRCAEYEETNNVLAALEQVPGFYPSVVDRILQKIEQQENGYREQAAEHKVYGRELKPSVSMATPFRVARPAALLPAGLLFLLIMTIVVYILIGSNVVPHKTPQTTQPAPTIQPLPRQPTPTPIKPTKHQKHSQPGSSGSPSPTVTVTPGTKPTPPSAPKPYITICATSDGGNGYWFYAKICGYDFHPGDVVVVISTPKSQKQMPPVIVDTHGQFVENVRIFCQDYPNAIYATDQTSGVTTAPIMQIPNAWNLCSPPGPGGRSPGGQQN